MPMHQVKKELRFEEIKWRAMWFRVIGMLLEEKPSMSLDLDQFAGYYFLNCMLAVISRKQEMARLKTQFGDSLYDREAMSQLSKRVSNYIGKDIMLQENRDANKNKLNSVQYL